MLLTQAAILAVVIVATVAFQFRKELFNNPNVFALIVGAVTAPFLFFRYLDTAGDKGKTSMLGYRLQELEARLEARDANISKMLKSATGDTVDLAALSKQLKDSIIEQGASEVLEEVRARVAKDYEQTVLAEILEAPQKRLEQEIAELRRRSNVNLFIGIVLGLAGLAILGWVAFRDSSTSVVSNVDFLRAHVPRISLGILVEFLAYFFLRLYKAAAAEVRYYHNELTNHESRMTAVELTWMRGDQAAITGLITSMLAIERNFILTKEQTTSDLEARKLEVQANEAVIRSLTDVIKNFSPSSVDGKKH